MISHSEARAKLASNTGVLLLDVRNEVEYQAKHISNSLLIPLDRLSEMAAQKLPDREQEIIVHCQSGGRSKMAVELLKRMGYTKVYNLGGINSWPYEIISGR